MFAFPERASFDLQMADGSMFLGCRFVEARLQSCEDEHEPHDGVIVFDYVGPLSVTVRVQARLRDVVLVVSRPAQSFDDELSKLT